MLTSILRLSLKLALALALTGCALGSPANAKPRWLTVEVRDADTGGPVAGAVLDARTLFFFNPDYPHGIFDPDPKPSFHAVTGPEGTASVKIYNPHPTQLIVVAPGYPPAVVEMNELPAGHDATGWIDPQAEVMGRGMEPRVKVRLVPGPS